MDWNNPVSYGVVIGALGLIGGIVLTILKIGEWKARRESTETSLEKSFKSLETTLTDFMAEIRTDVKKIFQRMESTVSGESPLKLTELGQSISETLGAAAWAERTAKETADKIPDKQPYVIQTYCFDFVRRSDMLSDELTRKIQESAYNNGIEVARVEDVLAIELRDALLKIHGLAPAESD